MGKEESETKDEECGSGRGSNWEIERRRRNAAKRKGLKAVKEKKIEIKEKESKSEEEHIKERTRWKGGQRQDEGEKKGRRKQA